MDKRELEGKLWQLCCLQDTMADKNISIDRPPVSRALQQLQEEFDRAKNKRQELIDEILDGFARAGREAQAELEDLKVENQRLQRMCNYDYLRYEDARRWAAAWKQAAKKKRAQAAAFAALLRDRYEKILEARAECSRLFNLWEKARLRTGRYSRQLQREHNELSGTPD